MSDLKVVPVKPRSAASAEDCRRVVASFLEKTGEMDSVALVAVEQDGSVATQFYVGRSAFALTGAIDHLRNRMHRDVIE